MKNFLLVFLALFMSVANAKLEIGKPVPTFTLEDFNGKKFSFDNYKDKIVVLEWINPKCPFSMRHIEKGTMESTFKKYQNKEVVWFGIDSSNSKAMMKKDEYMALLKDKGITYPVLFDTNGEIGQNYQALTTPHMFVINKGSLAYHGAIDNNPHNDQKEIMNYVDMALSGLTSNGRIPAQVKAYNKEYGCSVKY